MPFSTKSETYNVEKKEKDQKKKKKEKTQVGTTKVKPQLNPYCSKCPHKPPQSLTPKDERKYKKKPKKTTLNSIKQHKKKFHHFQKN